MQESKVELILLEPELLGSHRTSMTSQRRRTYLLGMSGEERETDMATLQAATTTQP
jgi:hypothetical protein